MYSFIFTWMAQLPQLLDYNHITTNGTSDRFYPINIAFFPNMNLICNSSISILNILISV